MIVTLVNPKHDTDVRVDCVLPGVSAKSVSAQLLHHPNLNAANTFDQPDTVVPKAFDVRLDSGSIRVELPRLSIMTAHIQIA